MSDLNRFPQQPAAFSVGKSGEERQWCGDRSMVRMAVLVVAVVAYDLRALTQDEFEAKQKELEGVVNPIMMKV